MGAIEKLRDGSGRTPVMGRRDKSAFSQQKIVAIRQGDLLKKAGSLGSNGYGEVESTCEEMRWGSPGKCPQIGAHWASGLEVGASLHEALHHSHVINHRREMQRSSLRDGGERRGIGSWQEEEGGGGKQQAS
jgi:hypothetical protein